MSVGRIVLYVFAAMLAGVTIGLLKTWPAPEPAGQDVAQPLPPAVASISVPGSSAPPPSSSAASPAPSPAPSATSPASAEKPAAVSPQAATRRGPGPELPPGVPVRAQGEGWWRTIAGTTAQFGTGRVHTYSVEVEQGAVLPNAHQSFAATVDAALADRRGWTAGGGIAFRRVDVEEPDVRIRLTATETARSICGYELPYDTSCYAGGVVYVSAPRWFRGAESFGGDLEGYRRYVVNHEIGHFLGHGHEFCPADGAPAPVMMQQTFSVSNDELARITAATPQGPAVPRDGRTCTANPWPHPEVTR
ncbi:DUF3152 domain-containing protein [Lentzea sp.]|uniref:DUF3152 domain-containing protein n=1 Tax=Lentzea sp. TaxID=56099 RepID=UPI002ED5985F